MRTPLFAALLSVLLLNLAGCPETIIPAEAERADVIEALLDVEDQFDANPPAAVRLPGLNAAYDDAAGDYFEWSLTSATLKLRDLAATRRLPSLPTPEQLFLQTIRARVYPFTYVLGNGPVYLELASIAPATTRAATSTLRVRVVGDQGNTVIDTFVAVPLFNSLVSELVPLDIPADLTPGRYRVEFVDTLGQTWPVSRWRVVSQSLDEVRAANDARLSGVNATTASLADALVAARARNGLLTNAPSEMASYAYLVDPGPLADEVNAEIDALLAGRDPYAGRIGDYWRAVASPTGDAIPLRVYVPADLPDGPVPLIIALHGAGGDENLFFDGYGNGLIKQLADQHGLIVVAPLTGPVLLDATTLDRVLTSLRDDYTIDARRIYLTGHSLGAVTAAQVAPQYADRVAAIALLGGGPNIAGADRTPPAIVYAAQYDETFPVDLLSDAVASAQADGLPVELSYVANYGHTMMVAASLPDAVAWLLQHELP